MSDHGTVTRQERVTVPSPGCLVAVMVPIGAVLIVSLVLGIMYHRQENANDRHKAEAVRKTAAAARSYAQDVVAAPHHLPGREAVRGIAQRHDGKLISYVRSGSSLATIVQLFAEYKETSMFGASYSRAYKCYSIVFRKDVKEEWQETTTSLEKCNVI
ncbi:hypothetical protein ABZ387_35150 [Streptomyces flaveolus]|uniref:hypothetical protein n=1 Tax=Streptomyces flaveolus TaxID=67297 RepID=UPI0033E74743